MRSTTTATGEGAASAGVKATSIRTRLLRYPDMYCYRHPDRETGLSCSECDRPICTDCMTVAPVGLRCPDHATNRQQPAAGRTDAGARGDLVDQERLRHAGADRAQRDRLHHRRSSQGQGHQRSRRRDLLKGPALRASRGAGGLVAADHLRVPPREPPPPRLQPARALVVRRAGRALPRTRALPARLHRLRPRRSGGCPARVTERRHGRSVGRDLRDPRRRCSSSSGSASTSSAEAR